MALVGMQPRTTHVPPRRCFSTMAVRAPSWAARMAATYPPGPPPITATSKRSGTIAPFDGGIQEDYDPNRRHHRAVRHRSAVGASEGTRGGPRPAGPHCAARDAVRKVPVGDRHSPVAAERAGRDLHPRRPLPALVLAAVD